MNFFGGKYLIICCFLSCFYSEDDGSGLNVPPITVSNVPPSVVTSKSFFKKPDYRTHS